MRGGLLRARDAPRENIFSFQLAYGFALMLKPGGGGGGTPHTKEVGMLVGNFELNP